MAALFPTCVPIALSLLFAGQPGHVAQLNMNGSWTVRDWTVLQHFAHTTPVEEGRCLAQELIAQKDDLTFGPAQPDAPNCDKTTMWKVILHDPVYRACHEHIS